MPYKSGIIIIFFLLFLRELFANVSNLAFLYPALPDNSYRNFKLQTNSTVPNIRVFPSQYFQIETFIATHPTNSLILLGSAITGDINIPSSMGYTTGIFISSDGGINWQGTDAIRDASNNVIPTVGDPTVIIDRYGNFILPYIAFPPQGGGLKVGVSYSTNNGLYWSQTVYVPGVDTADKVVSTTDNNSKSSYYGRSYIVYSDGVKGIFFSYTTNSGINWSLVQRISPPVNSSRTGVNIVTGPTGNIYVTWPYDQSLGFAKSLNGGINWTSTDNGINIYPPTDSGHIFFLNDVIVNGLPVIAVDNSGGSRNGWVYVVSSEKGGLNSPALDDCDLILHRSTNEGINWETKSHRVNQDNTGSLRLQFFPAINIDKYGGINILYFDTRNSQALDSCNVYLSRSLDGGNSFKDFLISDHKFKPKAIQGLYGLSLYAGSYIGITSGNNKLHPLWYDDHTGIYQAWTSSFDIRPIVNVKVIPQGFYNSQTQKLRLKDTIVLYLRNPVSPFARIDSSVAVIDTVIFTSSFEFKNATSGNYYLEIRHRNSIETWSGNTVFYSTASNLFYDFTFSASQAYGSNMILINGRYAIYSGDVNQDGIIDASDLSLVDNAVFNAVSGYVPEDCNGDSFVDGSDLSIVDNNAFNGISKITP